MIFFQTVAVIATLAIATVASYGNTLLVSNYPEEIREPGKLVEAVLTDTSTRLMYYHINRATHDFVIQTAVQNLTDQPVTIRVKKGLGGPSKDGIFAGHRSAKLYWESRAQTAQRIVLHPFQRAIIVAHTFRPETVSTALIDIDTDKRHAVKLINGVIDTEFQDVSLLNIPAVRYIFGTFDQTIKKIEHHYSFSIPVQEIGIGSAPFLHDPLSGILLRGNYGLEYDITININNPTPTTRTANLLFAPVGGVARGAILVNGQLVETKFIDQRTNFEPHRVHQVTLKPGAQTIVRVQTIPQGGCYYPVNLVISSPPDQF